MSIFYPVINYKQCEECDLFTVCGCKELSGPPAWDCSTKRLKVSPMDCIGCMECVKACIKPIKAIQIIQLTGRIYP